ncbi:MAG: 50S ribosomal protein L18 [Gemmatimonadota bacterium]|nr:50S ribosomal protein L18 [Gemmatimonadota bacterium]
MKSVPKQRKSLRGRRHGRIKRKVRGTAGRPRLVVFRSLKHIEGQVVDDDRGVTLLGLSSRSVEDAEVEGHTGKVAESYATGRRLAALAREAGVTEVVFDRAGYPYHGRVKAFAEGAREGGLRF